jgi:hypothetical protein
MSVVTFDLSKTKATIIQYKISNNDWKDCSLTENLKQNTNLKMKLSLFQNGNI